MSATAMSAAARSGAASSLKMRAVLFTGTACWALTTTAANTGNFLKGCTTSPTPDISAGTPAMQTGTSAPSDKAIFCQSTGAQTAASFACLTKRRTAAASAEPPPRPAAMGRFLCSETCPNFICAAWSCRSSNALSIRPSRPSMAPKGPDKVTPTGPFISSDR